MKHIAFEDVRVGAIAVNGLAFVQNVIQNVKSLYFTTPNGIFARLSYEGVNGWRLQANAKGYEFFDIVGAS